MTSPTRILACSGSLDGGGSERQLWQLVRNLERPVFAPDVYLLYRRGPYLDQLPPDARVLAFSDRYPSPQSRWPGSISRLQVADLRRAAKQFGSQIVYDRTFHMSLLTGSAFPRGTLPRVSVIVSPPSRDLPQTEHRFVGIKRWLLSRSYRRAQVILAVSEDTADDAAKYYRLPRPSIRVLPNPIDVERVRALADQPIALDRTRNIVVVGRMTPEKGHELAIRSFERFLKTQASQAEHHLHFIGDGPLRSELESLVEQLGLAKLVSFHGYQINPYPWMARADLVLVPSRYEGFPNVALEAMALSTPLLLNNFGNGARQVIGEHGERGSLFESNLVESCVGKMQDRYKNDEAWQGRARRGALWVEQNHAIAPWLMQMQEIFHQLLRKENR